MFRSRMFRSRMFPSRMFRSCTEFVRPSNACMHLGTQNLNRSHGKTSSTAFRACRMDGQRRGPGRSSQNFELRHKTGNYSAPAVGHPCKVSCNRSNSGRTCSCERGQGVHAWTTMITCARFKERRRKPGRGGTNSFFSRMSVHSFRSSRTGKSPRYRSELCPRSTSPAAWGPLSRSVVGGQSMTGSALDGRTRAALLVPYSMDVDM